jgi:hypothetical protein
MDTAPCHHVHNINASRTLKGKMMQMFYRPKATTIRSHKERYDKDAANLTKAINAFGACYLSNWGCLIVIEPENRVNSTFRKWEAHIIRMSLYTIGTGSVK